MPEMQYASAQSVAVDDRHMPEEPGPSGMDAFARVTDTEGNVLGLFRSQ